MQRVRAVFLIVRAEVRLMQCNSGLGGTTLRGKKTYIDYLALVILLLLAAACLLSVSPSSNQASLSFPLPLTFRGEYSYDGEADPHHRAVYNEITIKRAYCRFGGSTL